MPRKPPCASALHCAATDELLEELRRRSLACLAVCVRAEEGGDAWRCAVKGSPILLGAMSAALSLEIRRKLAGERAGGDEQMAAV